MDDPPKSKARIKPPRQFQGSLNVLFEDVGRYFARRSDNRLDADVFFQLIMVVGLMS